MNKNRQVLNLFFAAFTLLSCNAETANEDASVDEKNTLDSRQEERSIVNKNEPLGEVEADIGEGINKQPRIGKIPFPEQVKSIMLNGTKMTGTKFPLIKGSVVFDTAVNQRAKLTGNLIVVFQAKSKQTVTLQSEYEVKKIAQNTYSLVPKNSEDLLLNYKALESIETIDKVELGLDYTPADDRAEM
jgi:hypothetical protein